VEADPPSCGFQSQPFGNIRSQIVIIDTFQPTQDSSFDWTCF
jgi:hypothetical protein